jgi:GNAT superfamily N-acetyltransferase
VAGEEDGTTWMNARERPDVTPLPEGFVLVNRARETTTPHPMRHRNGEQVEARLRQCSLYDPALDLAAETADGQVGGYALFWFDPVTQVGMLEPMRVEDEYQRRGLARAMLNAVSTAWHRAGHAASRSATPPPPRVRSTSARASE